jgi:3-hydroxyisobutyrate dehydrogenase-like beta-hydroxyacid dehydrogenase
MFKDYNLLLAEADQLGVSLPQTRASRAVFAAAMEQGLGDKDMAAVYKVLDAQGSKK